MDRVARRGGAEIHADRYEISHEAQEQFALRSHERATAAWERGDYADEVVDLPAVQLERDQPIRETSLEKLGALKPGFRSAGTVTAGNSSPLNDGAAALLLADGPGVEAIGREPLARIVSHGVHAVDPPLYGIAPVEAANRTLARAGVRWTDLSAVELGYAPEPVRGQPAAAPRGRGVGGGECPRAQGGRGGGA